MRFRSGQTPTPAIIVASIFALMLIGTVTFFVYQFQKGGTHTTNTNKNKNKNTAVANKNTTTNTNTSTTVDLSPLTPVPDSWKLYTSTLAAFSLRYPDNWKLEEVNVPDDPIQKVPVKYVRFTDPSGQVYLTFGMRAVGQTFGVGGRTTAPVGTFKTGLTLTMAGIDSVASQLVSDGKVTAIFYYPTNPLGFTYIQGNEVQAEIDLAAVPGVASPITDLAQSSLTQIANTILSTMTLTGSSSQNPPPPVNVPPLGQYKVEVYKETPTSDPDTRLVNTDGGIRTVVINSTRKVAGLAAKHGLVELAFPAFGTYLYLQDSTLAGVPVHGDIWSYDIKAQRLLHEVSFPAVGYGKLYMNAQKTRAVYVSSTDPNDSGDIETLYLLDMVKKTVVSLLTLPAGQTFSAGWGGASNSFNISWKTDLIVHYTSFIQNSGDKQKLLRKDRSAEGEVAIPQ